MFKNKTKTTRHFQINTIEIKKKKLTETNFASMKETL
jgi:hypothetical protein